MHFSFFSDSSGNHLIFLWLSSHLTLSPHWEQDPKKHCLQTEQRWDCRWRMKWPQLAGWENCRVWNAGKIWRKHLCHFYSPTVSMAVFVFGETEKHKWWRNIEMTETKQWKLYYWFSWGIADSNLLGFNFFFLFHLLFFLIFFLHCLFTFSLLGSFLSVQLPTSRLLNINC